MSEWFKRNIKKLILLEEKLKAQKAGGKEVDQMAHKMLKSATLMLRQTHTYR
jgi:hypothetical protein